MGKVPPTVDDLRRRPLVLLLGALLSASGLLFAPVWCESTSGTLLVRDYALLGARGGAGSGGCGGGATGNLRDSVQLSELVAQSDVIFKAFAGHGNDLRDAALNRSAENHRNAAQQHHHQPRWKAAGLGGGPDADFVVRLEPGTVYKGNELFQQLQLNSWKHYFIIWSNGSVEYSHRGVPAQGRPSGNSSLDGRTFGSSGPRPPSEGEGILNCTAWRDRARMVDESTRPVITEPGSSAKRGHPKAVGTDKTWNSRAAGEDSEEDNGKVNLSRAVRHTLPPNEGPQKRSTSTNERVNLPDGRDEPTDSHQVEATPMGKDSNSEDQISHALNEILPVTLIVFGRRVTDDESAEENSLRVDPYVGLLRWDERLEGALWQALGWSKWSDYTGCSVGCGSGVQQRFRHCLLSGAGRPQPLPGGSHSRPPTAARGTPGRTRPSSGSSIDESRMPAPHVSWRTAEYAEPPTDADLRTQPPTAYVRPPGVSIGAEADGAPPTKGKKNRSWKKQPKRTVQRENIREESGGTSAGTRPNFTADGDTWPSCEGHNIEQRSCNTFDCTGTIDLLTALTPDNHWRNWNEGIDDRINYEINRLEQNFTLMISLRVRHHHAKVGTAYEADAGRAAAAGGSVLSVRSKLTTGPSLSINFVTDGHGGLRVIQEKYGLSEMLPVREPALLDGEWHSLALSGRNGGGFVTVYGDCRWINSFVLTKGSIELPQYPTVDIGRDVELRQLTVVPGEKSARLQCHSPAVPIRDVENRQVTNYFEHLN